MANETHNLGIGLDANITKVNRKLNKLADNVQTLSAKLNKIENASSKIRKTTNALDDQNDEVKKANKKIEELNDNYDKLQKESKQNARAIERVNDKLEENARNSRKADRNTKNFTSSFSSSMGVALKSISIWGLATSAIYGSVQAMREMVTAIKEVNTQMIDLQKVMGDNINNIDEIRSSASKLGQDYARGIDKVVEQMVEWGRQGYEQSKVIELVQTTLASANATNIKSADSVKYLVATLSQFNIEAENSMMVIDKFNEVSNNFANTTAKDLAEAVKEAGASANTMNISLDQTVGMVTAIAEASAKSGNRIGRSMRTMFANVAQVTRKTGDSINALEEKLSEHDISLRKTSDEYNNTFAVLDKLADQWEELSQIEQQSIANAMGNKRRYTDVINLLKNWDTAIEATQASMNSFGSALEENERYMTSLEAHFQQARTSAQQTAVTLGEAGIKGVLKDLSNVIKDFFQSLTDIIVGFQEWNSATKDVLRGILTITTAITSLSIAIKGFKAILTAINFSALLTNPLGIATLVIGSATAAIGYFSHKIGKNKRETEELENARKSLNKVIKDGTKISYNQALQVEKQIKPLENLAQKYREIKAIRKNIKMGFLNEIDLTKMNFIKELDTYSNISALNHLKKEQKETIDEMVKNAKLMPNTFKKINESFKNMTDEEIYQSFANGLKEINGLTREAIKNLTEMSAISLMGDGQYEEFATNITDAFDSIINKIKTMEKGLEDIGETLTISLKQIRQKSKLNLFDTELEKEKAVLKAYQKQMNSLFNLQKKMALFEKDLTQSETVKRVEQIKKTIGGKIEELKSLQDLTDDDKELTKTQQKRLTKYKKMSYQINNSKDPIQTIKKLSDDINGLIEISVKEYLKQEEVVSDISDELKKQEKSQNRMLDAWSKRTQGYKNMKNDFFGRVGEATDFSGLSVKEMRNRSVKLKNLIKEGINKSYDVSKIKDKLKQLSKMITNATVGQMRAGLVLYKKELKELADAKWLKSYSNILKHQGNVWSSAAKSAEDFGTQLNKMLATNYKSMGKEELSGFIGKLEKLASTGKELSGRWIDTRHLKVLLDYLKEANKEYDNLFQGMMHAGTVTYKDNKEKSTIKKIKENYQSVMPEIEKIKNNLADARTLLADAPKEWKDEAKKYVEYWKDKLIEFNMLSRESNNIAAEKLLMKHEEWRVQLKINKAIAKQSALASGDRYQARFDKIQETIDRIQNADFGGISKSNSLINQLKSLDNLTSKQKKQMKEIIKELEKNIKGTKFAWGKAVGDGIANAIDNYNEFDTFAHNLQSSLQSVLGGIFNDPSLVSDLKSLLDGTFGADKDGKGGIGLGLSNTATTGVMSGLSTVANGGSIGAGVMSGIGSAVGVANPILGGVISGVGKIGGALWGSNDGEDPSTVKALKSQVESAKEYLKDYNISDLIPEVKSKDNASTWQKFWGGSDIEILNEEEIKEKIESVKSIIGNLGSAISNTLKNAVTNDLSVADFKKSLDQSLGKAIMQSVIDATMKSKVVTEMIGGLTKEVQDAINDRDVTPDEIDDILEEASDTKEGLSDIYEQLKPVLDELGVEVDEGNTSNEQTFQAGATTNVTYNSTYQVRSQYFGGNEEDAQAFARVMKNYIVDLMERDGDI